LHSNKVGALQALAILALAPGAAHAQTSSPPPAVTLDNNEISKQAENPVSNLATLPLRYEADFNDGPYDATKSTFELDQAVVPFSINDNWSLITRTKLPFISDPPKKLHDPWQTGFGNGYTTFFLSPRQGEGFYWGIGPVLSYPSATNSATGVNKWGLGPSVAILKKDAGPWQWGAVVNNIWSLGGPPHGSKNRTNTFLLNPFISYHFANGWALGSSPNVAANWLAVPGQDWTLPVGGGVSKTLRVGRQPVKLALDGYYNAIRPPAGDLNWVAMLTLTFVFPD